MPRAERKRPVAPPPRRRGITTVAPAAAEAKAPSPDPTEHAENGGGGAGAMPTARGCGDAEAGGGGARNEASRASLGAVDSRRSSEESRV